MEQHKVIHPKKNIQNGNRIRGAVFESNDGIERAADRFIQMQHQRMQEERYEKRQKEAETKAEKNQRFTNDAVINSLTNRDNYSVGDMYEPWKTEQLQNIKNKYTELNRKGTIDPVTLRTMLETDMTKLSRGSQMYKVFSKSVDEVAKDYKDAGLNKSEMNSIVRDKVFYSIDDKGNRKLKPFYEIDFEHEIEALPELVKSNAYKVANVNEYDVARKIQSRQLSEASTTKTVATKDPSGRTVYKQVRGTMKYDPLFDEVTTDDKGNVTGVEKRTQQFIDHDNKPYIDPVTGQPANPVIKEDTYQYVFNQDKKATLLFESKAQKEAEELRAKGFQIGLTDVEYLKRKAVTDFVNAHSKIKEDTANANKELQSKAKEAKVKAESNDKAAAKPKASSKLKPIPYEENQQALKPFSFIETRNDGTTKKPSGVFKARGKGRVNTNIFKDKK